MINPSSFEHHTVGSPHRWHMQGFRVELAPNEEQLTALGQHAGLSRVVENFALARVLAALDQREAEKTYGLPLADLTAVPWSAPALEAAWRVAHPTQFPWFTKNRLSSRVPKEACRVRATALANFFDSRSGKRAGARLGFPTWRRRKHGGRFRYDSHRAKPCDARTMWLPGIGAVSTREDMTWLTERIATSRARVLGATVKETAGRWWISLQIEVDRQDINLRHAVATDAPSIGIDLGLKTFATISDDAGNVTVLTAPRPLAAAQRALRRLNMALARSQPMPKNRAKIRAKLGKLHFRVSSRRGDFLHKVTTELARTRSAIAVETLSVKNMSKNRRLARAIADAGWAEFVRQLEYKPRWYGASLWRADRWFPSSKLCGNPTCGRRHAGLALADRTWTCTACGAVHDRDANAAGNLLTAMLAATTA